MARMLLILLSILYIGSDILAQEELSHNSEHINGILLTDFGEGVEGAKIIITDDDGSLLPLVVTTNNLGQFSIDGLSKDVSFQIKPQKIDDAQNGVDIWDLYQLTNAIGASQFESSYQKFAADVNGDGILSEKDISILKNYILGVGSLPFSWRFYDASCLPPLINPFGTCSHSISYDKKDPALSFVGVKVGDLNSSALANRNQIPEHVYGQMTLNTATLKLRAGQEYNIDISLDGDDVVASQFSLDLGSLKLIDVIASGISILESDGVHQEQNIVTFAQIGSEANQAFTLKVRATVEANLSEVLSLATDYSSAKIYDSEGELYGLKLSFGGDFEEHFILYQNNPNPFADVTNIRFYLPKTTVATLTIYDLNGQRLKTVQTYCQKGLNNIAVLKSDLNLTGICFYKLVAGNNSAIRKMMLIE